MKEIITCQGKAIRNSDILWLKAIINDNPDWSRHQITKEICDHWNWRTQTGQMKTFAARSMIDKLEQRGYLHLPPVRTTLRRNLRPPFPDGFTPQLIYSITEDLKSLSPISIHIPEPCSVEQHRFKGTCYKAVNWIWAGQTKGRSRQERHGKMVVPIKDIFLYPLSRNFRQALCGESS